MSRPRAPSWLMRTLARLFMLVALLNLALCAQQIVHGAAWWVPTCEFAGALVVVALGAYTAGCAVQLYEQEQLRRWRDLEERMGLGRG